MRSTMLRSLLAFTLAAGTVMVPAAATPARQHAAHRTDALQDKLATRASAVDAKLSAARVAGRVSRAEESQLKRKLAWVRSDAAKNVEQQGFLSAAESASYHRALDAIEAKLS